MIKNDLGHTIKFKSVTQKQENVDKVFLKFVEYNAGA
jgi:hypothetical protein